VVKCFSACYIYRREGKDINTYNAIESLERLHSLIKRGATGSPKQLARRLEVSERQVYRHIDQLKGMGLPVDFHKQRQTYHYTEDVTIKILITVEERIIVKVG
jgi:biotin operon repressor